MKYAYTIDYGTYRQNVVWDKDPEWVIDFYNAFKGMAVIDWKELPVQKVEEPKRISCGCTLKFLCKEHMKQRDEYYKSIGEEPPTFKTYFDQPKSFIIVKPEL